MVSAFKHDSFTFLDSIIVIFSRSSDNIYINIYFTTNKHLNVSDRCLSELSALSGLLFWCGADVTRLRRTPASVVIRLKEGLWFQAFKVFNLIQTV